MKQLFYIFLLGIILCSCSSDSQEILSRGKMEDIIYDMHLAQIRGALVPVANFGSTIAWPLILLGLFFNSQMSQVLLNLGILAFSLAVLFQIVTLPVEFNASRRAIKILSESNLLYPDELSGTKKVLTAAALTYVAGAASAILQLLRILILTGGRRDD